MANIFIYSPNVVGTSMAGPAIRAWEIAKALSSNHSVTLVTPNLPDIKGDGFQLIPKADSSLRHLEKQADVFIVQVLTLKLALTAKRYGIKIIADAYDPVPLEILELFKHKPLQERYVHHHLSMEHLLFNFKMADGIICASEKQRDLWLGLLLSLGKIHPHSYDQDQSLRLLIDVVPFGLANDPPQRTGSGLRDLYGFKSSDKVLLWGGGIWNWFDPLSLIKAMKLIQNTRPDIKLVFMGIKNPDPSVPAMAMSVRAIELAKELQLFNSTVFFNEGWVPYHDRQNYLMDADAGVSMHFDHLETRFSFRTRMLDYIWTQLPIIATAGDSFADLIQQQQLGSIVPSENPEAIATAVLSLFNQPQQILEIKARLLDQHTHFKWNTVVKPIHNMIQSLVSKRKSSWSYQDIKHCSQFFYARVKQQGIKNTAKIAAKKLAKHLVRKEN